MQSIVLQVAQDVDVSKIVSLLKPFGKAVTVEPLVGKEVRKTAHWLGTVYKVRDFKPLKREELYDR